MKVKARGESEEKRYTGRLEMPADVYNGMVITIAKNLSLKETQRVHVVAFTPKPMLIEVEYAPEHVPAFVRFQGPLVTGPVWRIDLIGPNTQ